MINRVYKASIQRGSGWYKVQKGDEVTPIKYGTFHYAATAGNLSTYGKGGAFSSYIEFEYYTSDGVTLNKGDMLLYAQEWDTDTSFESNDSESDIVGLGQADYMTLGIGTTREQGINIFYVSEIKEKRETNYILAYDCVEALLDVDFSETLKANEANFPMTISSLYGLVRTLTGVYAPWDSPLLFPPGRDNYWKQAKINYFYSPGITARNILNWIGEISGQTLLASWSGEAASTDLSKQTTYKTFTDNENQSCGWQTADKYAVCPGDGTYTVNGNTAINAWYKETGLEIGKAFTTYDGVEIVAADGSLLGSYYTATPATNVLRIVGNMIVENISEFANIYNPPGVDTGIVGTYDDLAEDILASANVVSGMTAAKIELFPFRCPYTIGSRMYCVDPDGNQYIVPIMSIDLTESGVTIGAYGGEIVDDVVDSPSEATQTSALWVKVNALTPVKDNITATTNAYGNVFTTLDGNNIIICAIRTGNTASVCTPFWNEATGVFGIHVAGMSGSAVANTSVTIEYAYIKRGSI